MKSFLFTICLSAISAVYADPSMPQQPQEMQQQPMSQIQQTPQNPQDMQGVATEDVVWITDFNAAQKIAKDQNKPLFLYFTGSDWCPWCMKMDKEILSTSGFKKSAGSEFVFVKVDSPRYLKIDPKIVEQNMKLKEQYKIIGFPTILVLDPDMNQVGMFYYKEETGDAYGKKLVDAWKEYKAKKSVTPQTSSMPQK